MTRRSLFGSLLALVGLKSKPTCQPDNSKHIARVLVNTWMQRARSHFVTAMGETEDLKRRGLEMAGMCCLNCANELRDALGTCEFCEEAPCACGKTGADGGFIVPPKLAKLPSFWDLRVWHTTTFYRNAENMPCSS